MGRIIADVVIFLVLFGSGMWLYYRSAKRREQQRFDRQRLVELASKGETDELPPEVQKEVERRLRQHEAMLRQAKQRALTEKEVHRRIKEMYDRGDSNP